MNSAGCTSQNGKIKKGGDFPGGPVVKTPLSNAGGAGLVPSQGRSHIAEGCGQKLN